MIILTVIVVSYYSIHQVVENGVGPEFKPMNSKVWDMIGFSFYSFEGIGVIMPIMEQSRDKQNFPKVLSAALLTLAGVFVFFGLVSYMNCGYNKMDEKFIVYNIKPQDSVLEVTELLYCVNLVFSYPLTIFPANKILESYLFHRMLGMNEVTTTRKWLKNLSRGIIVFLGVFLSITLKDVLDDFLGVTGAVLGI